MRAAVRDTIRTARNGVLLIAAVVLVLVFGPRAELLLAPPVSLWEIHNPRIEAGEIRWSVLVAQVRDCRADVVWRSGATVLAVAGPPFDFKRGEAAEIGTYRTPAPPGATEISATVTYNCGWPWALAAISKSAAMAH